MTDRIREMEAEQAAHQNWIDGINAMSFQELRGLLATENDYRRQEAISDRMREIMGCKCVLCGQPAISHASQGWACSTHYDDLS